MAKSKKKNAKSNNKGPATRENGEVDAQQQAQGGSSSTASTSANGGINGAAGVGAASTTSSSSSTPLTGTAGDSGGGGSGSGGNSNNSKENLDTMDWLRYCENRRDADGEPYLQLEYQEDDDMMQYLQRFLEQSIATKQVVEIVYQIWQQTVLSTLLASTKLWKKENVTTADQRLMKDKLKFARYKINFIMHHAVGAMLTSPDPKWKARKTDLLQLAYQTLQLLPRLAESAPHHKTDIRQVIMHFEVKEFLASAACETWDTLYDYSIPIDPARFIPVLRRCAMLDILDKDWNMLGGWEDILKGLEAKCCLTGPVVRLPCDVILHEHTTILRNARNSMQCKFFSVRFMRYTEDQAPQRWRYFPKCSAPACAHIETSEKPHVFRCRKCWYFHYCSEACQEYCDNIMGLHPKFCKDTPVSKAALCQKETETHLGWAADPSSMDAIFCQACGMTEEQPSLSSSSTTSTYTTTTTSVNSNNNNNTASPSATTAAASTDNDNQQQSAAASNTNATTTTSTSQMKRCSKCQKVYYCSRQCQEWDWRHGGHKRACKPEGAAGAATTMTTAICPVATTPLNGTNTTTTTATTTTTNASSISAGDNNNNGTPTRTSGAAAVAALATATTTIAHATTTVTPTKKAANSIATPAVVNLN